MLAIIYITLCAIKINLLPIWKCLICKRDHWGRHGIASNCWLRLELVSRNTYKHVQIYIYSSGVGGFIGAAFTCLTSCACLLLWAQDKLTSRWKREQEGSKGKCWHEVKQCSYFVCKIKSNKLRTFILSYTKYILKKKNNIISQQKAFLSARTVYQILYLYKRC